MTDIIRSHDGRVLLGAQNPAQWQMHNGWHQREVGAYLLDILRNERASISPFRDRAVDLDIAEVFPDEDEHIDPVDDAIEIISKDEQARRSAVIMRQERELATYLAGYDRRGREIKRRYYEHSPGSEARAEEAVSRFGRAVRHAAIAPANDPTAVAS